MTTDYRIAIDVTRDRELAAEKARHRAACDAIEAKRLEALDKVQWLDQQYPATDATEASATAPVVATVKVQADAHATPTDPVNIGLGRGWLVTAMKQAMGRLEDFTADTVGAEIQRATGRPVIVKSIASNLSRLAHPSCGEVETVTKGSRGKAQVYRKGGKFSLTTGVPKSKRRGSKPDEPEESEMTTAAS